MLGFFIAKMELFLLYLLPSFLKFAATLAALIHLNFILIYIDKNAFACRLPTSSSILDIVLGLNQYDLSDMSTY